VHIPPVEPHVAALVPSWHVVPSQQPPLHCPVSVQSVEQVRAVQAWLFGQSVATLQPHTLLKLRHALPCELPVQVTHDDPEPQ